MKKNAMQFLIVEEEIQAQLPSYIVLGCKDGSVCT